MFDLVFVLFLVKKDFIIKEKDCKKYIFLAIGFSYFKIFFILLAKIITFHIQVFIILIRIFYFMKPI